MQYDLSHLQRPEVAYTSLDAPEHFERSGSTFTCLLEGEGSILGRAPVIKQIQEEIPAGTTVYGIAHGIVQGLGLLAVFITDVQVHEALARR